MAPAETVAVAGVNTAILLASSLTIHWALVSIKNGNRFGLKAGMLSTFFLGLTFLFVQVNEYVHIGFAPHDFAQGSVFYGLDMSGIELARTIKSTSPQGDFQLILLTPFGQEISELADSRFYWLTKP